MVVNQAKTPRAFINVKSAGFVDIDELTNTETVYGDALLARGIKSVSAESSGEIVTANGDGMEIESARSPGQATLSLLMHEFSPDVREKLFDEKPDESGLAKDKIDRQPKEVGFFFNHERKDGTFKFYYYPRVVFNDPGLDAAQRSEGTVEFTEETSEGRVLYTFHDEARKYTYDSRRHADDDTAPTLRTALESIFGSDYEGLDQIESYITGKPATGTTTDGTESAGEV